MGEKRDETNMAERRGWKRLGKTRVKITEEEKGTRFWWRKYLEDRAKWRALPEDI